MSRISSIFGRYGRRTFIVVLALTGARLVRMKRTLTLKWLNLTTLGKKGKGIVLGQDVYINPGGYLELGDGIHIGDRCIFEVGVNPPSCVIVGSDTWLSHDCHISSCRSVTIGNHVLIGEFVSVRDSTHRYESADIPIKRQGDILGSITIEDDVWVGRGCLIQGRPEGVVLGRGAIIAANSVVTRSIPAMQVWGGVPARFIKERSQGRGDSITP
jgi:acetyltransferase-like isoleucine patch superfamily enzyme